MVLEATMICIDNSEWMRNGDYSPNRGSRVSHPTSDLGKNLSLYARIRDGGEMNLATGIQVAQLALKHRQNKKQQQDHCFCWQSH
ncbi:hypothetical protein HAX54_012222 [Datura stramonium]|uniref:VWFA domain-containing protein n=1 Tax=Datura stramonium TaxID=4076 RepID=A0ABS8TJE6_DATST|nr:hypothetical protein [Datura stramonium]